MLRYDMAFAHTHVVKYAAVFAALFVVALAPAASLKATATRAFRAAAVTIRHRDARAFDKVVRPYLTADFKCTEQGQTMDYAQMLAGMKQSMTMMKHVTQASAKVQSCTEHGNMGKTSTHHVIIGTVLGEDKKTHKMVFNGQSNDTWVKQGGKWKMSTMVWAYQKMTRDGKPFNPQMAPDSKSH